MSIFPICCINLTFQKPMQAANLTLERKFLFSVNTSESLWQLRMYFRPCWESPDQYYKKTFIFLSLWFDLPSLDWYFDLRWEPSKSTANIFQRLGRLNFVFLKISPKLWIYSCCSLIFLWVAYSLLSGQVFRAAVFNDGYDMLVTTCALLCFACVTLYDLTPSSLSFSRAWFSAWFFTWL